MEAQPNQDRIGDFWSRYRHALAVQSLRGKEADWYIKRAESFIKSARGLRLKEHTAEDLRAYLCRQAIDAWLKDWQYGQMVDALRILFGQIVKSPGPCRSCSGMRMFEAPRSKLRGIFDRREVCHFQIRSLTPQQATGNALAFAVPLR